MSDRQFPCVLCGRKFSVADIEALVYLMPSQVCHACYSGGRGPKCFGTYNPTEDACTRFCPDRAVCFQWPQLANIGPAQRQAVFAKATTKLAEKRVAQAKAKGRERSAGAPFRRDTMIGGFFNRACQPSGLALSELQAVCAEIEAPVKDYYRKLYSGFSAGWRWSVRLGTNKDMSTILYITDVERVVEGKKGKRK